MQFKFLVRKLFTTFQRQGVKGIYIKSLRRVKSDCLRLTLNNKKNKQEWKNLKNKYAGKRVFLIGNGPSLNKTPLYLLKDEYTMCFNRFSLFFERLNWTPSFFATTDNLVLSDLLTELDSVVSKSAYSFFPDIHFRGEKFINKIEQKDNILWIHQLFGRGFSTNLPKVFPGGSVIYEGFQILRHLGFKEIILLGVDMNFQIHKSVKYLDSKSVDIISEQDDDPNHFDPRYFGKNRKYHQPEAFVIQSIIDNLDFLGQNMDKFGLQILNAGYDSKVTSFPKVDFESLFQYDKDEKKKLFESLLSKNIEVKSIEQLEKNSVYLNAYRDINDETRHFITSEELALSIIKKVIFNYIPLGPFNCNYYFLKRDLLQ
ncbi:MAG: DUF115 domain-containing protein [Bacteroidales bacterium]|nr:DUF115 domain-containing protein [Bacteroidales bacterium]